MVLNFLWATGQILCIVALLCGANLALRETAAFNRLFGKASARPLSLLPKDLWVIASLSRELQMGRSASGNGLMDTQHQSLFDSTKNLQVAILSGQSMDNVAAIIESLIRDTAQHFQDEEEMLGAASYPGTAKHVIIHRELVSGATLRLGQFRSYTFGIGELFQYLSFDLLTTHMLRADREFSPAS